jgi:hypothetical protein
MAVQSAGMAPSDVSIQMTEYKAVFHKICLITYNGVVLNNNMFLLFHAITLTT